MKSRFIPLYRPVIDARMMDEASRSLYSERLILGKSVYRFEKEFSDYCGCKYAISTNSGTNALFLSLKARGIKPGDEVITTGMSFIATANAIIHVGAKAVFADIKPDGNIAPEDIEKKINSRTKAIIPVHLHGYPAAMDEILEIAEEYGLYVIEDACQAHGARYHGRKTGNLADAGCFSFNPMKNMTVGGDGGMITTNDKELADKARELADTGRRSCYEIKHGSIGYTARLNTINAAIGRVQLRNLERWNLRRRELANMFNDLLSDTKGISLPYEEENITPVYNKYVIRVEKGRDKLIDLMYKDRIHVDAHFSIPIQNQPAYEASGYNSSGFPGTRDYAAKTLSLPMFAGLREEEIERIYSSLNKNLKQT